MGLTIVDLSGPLYVPAQVFLQMSLWSDVVSPPVRPPVKVFFPIIILGPSIHSH